MYWYIYSSKVFLNTLYMWAASCSYPQRTRESARSWVCSVLQWTVGRRTPLSITPQYKPDVCVFMGGYRHSFYSHTFPIQSTLSKHTANKCRRLSCKSYVASQLAHLATVMVFSTQLQTEMNNSCHSVSPQITATYLLFRQAFSQRGTTKMVPFACVFSAK